MTARKVTWTLLAALVIGCASEEIPEESGPVAPPVEPAPPPIPVIRVQQGTARDILAPAADTGVVLVETIPEVCAIDCETLGLDRAIKARPRWFASLIPPGKHSFALHHDEMTLWSHAEVAAGGTTLVRVNFETGLVQQGPVHPFGGLYWSFSGRPEFWEVAGDILIGRNTADSSIVAIAGGMDWTEYVVEFRFKAVKGDFVFRCRGQFISEAEGWVFDSTPAFGQKLDREKWHRIRAEVRGNLIRWVWLDERRRQVFTMSSPSGPFALQVEPGGEVHFDKIRIER
jgi:hypothetical protein